MKIHGVVVEEFPGVVVDRDWGGQPIVPRLSDSTLIGTCIETGIRGNPACGEPRCEVTYERIKHAARAVSFHCAGAIHRLARPTTERGDR